VQHGKMAGCGSAMERRETSGINTEDTEGTEGTEAREYAGQDYCSVEWDGDVRWERYCLISFGNWASREDFRYEMAEGAQGEEVWRRRAVRTIRTLRPLARRLRRLQRDRCTASVLQDVVAQGLRRLGQCRGGGNSIHLSYEIVALTPTCAAEMGYELSATKKRRSHT